MLCHNSGCDVIRDISFNVDVLYSIMINRVESRYELFYLPINYRYLYFNKCELSRVPSLKIDIYTPDSKKDDFILNPHRFYEFH